METFYRVLKFSIGLEINLSKVCVISTVTHKKKKKKETTRQFFHSVSQVLLSKNKKSIQTRSYLGIRSLLEEYRLSCNVPKERGERYFKFNIYRTVI